MSNQGLSILLSFYHGQKFFEEQFLSIINQLKPEDELLIRDDGSNSLGYLKTITGRDLISTDFDLRKRINLLGGENVGVNKSFARLLKFAKNDVSVFCDQDDVWLPGRLDSVRANFSSDLHCVNYRVDERPQLPRKFLRSSYSSFVRNFVPGCCMSGKTLYLREIFANLDDDVIYDHALLYLSLSLGRNCTFDTDVHVMYRRHANTVTRYREFTPNGLIAATLLRYKLLTNRYRFHT